MFKRFLRCMSTFLVLVLLLNMLPVQSMADWFGGEQIQPIGTELIPPTTTIGKELVVVQEISDNRSEYSKEFLLSNGLHMAMVYAEPVHYEKDGKWVDIDNTLTIHTDGTYKNTAGPWEVSFPQSFSSNQSISVTKDGYTLSFGMPQKLTTGTGGAEIMSADAVSETFAAAHAVTTTAQLDSKKELLAAKLEAEYPETVLDKLTSRLTYSGIHSNTNVVYDLDSNRVKESIVIEKQDDTLRGYRYILNVGTMTPVLQDDGSIIFYAPDSETVVMAMPAPYLQDAELEISTDITVVLTGSGSQYILTYVLPQDWLNNENRQWPVILDPVIEADLDVDNVIDAVIASNHTYSYTNPFLDIGLGSSYGIKRSFLKYEVLPKLTSADVVVGATLTMRQLYYRSISIPAEVHKVTGDWHSTTITWNNQPGYDPIVEDFVMGNSAVDYKWDVTDIVQDWYRTGVNNGMMFKAPESVETGGVEKFRQFASSEYDVDHRPALQILFLNNNGLENHWDYSSASAGRAGTGSVNIYTGNLVWTHSDLGFGGNRMPVSISHIHNANDADNNSFGMGYGWRTNYNQLVYQWDENGDGTIQYSEQYYVWEDSDGTKHYFYKESNSVYKDEENIGLTLKVSGSGNSKAYTMEDKGGGKSCFDSKGRLVKIENNQKEPSNITIAYSETVPMQIASVTDGVGRVYSFAYENGFLSKISFMGSDNTEHTNIIYTYENDNLKTVKYADEETSTFTYGANHLITKATDIDGFELSYTYSEPEGDFAPYRVTSVKECHNGANGGHIAFEYQHHQTVLTDNVNEIDLTYQFNDLGNTVAVLDDEGRAEYAKFARNDALDTASPGNQLTLSSKMQNTVINLLPDSSFESSSNWLAATSDVCNVSTENHYLGNKSLKVINGNAFSQLFTAKAGKTYTFSGYVKVISGTAELCMITPDSQHYALSAPESNSDWARIQINYTNTTSSDQQVYAAIRARGTSYLDCVQVEQMPTASRYNLINNGDFATDAGWTPTNTETADGVTSAPTESSVLSTNAYKFTGKHNAEKIIKQEITVSGGNGDSFVFGGWAMGNSASLESLTNGVDKDFALRCTIKYTDGTTQVEKVQFNQDVSGWQFVSWAIAATKDYSSITLEAIYKNNANTAYFDGLQVFKEEFGTTYTYDQETGNLTSTVDLQNKKTQYQYDANSNLTQIIQGDNVEMTYTYDQWNNVETATTKEGYSYAFTYDDYGNNTSVSITEKSDSEVKKTMTSSATYTSNHNHIATSTDATGKITTYGYNLQTGLLDWVQYPEHTEDTRTEYTYDEMYRTASTKANLYNGATDTGMDVSVNYTYTNDLLTRIQTPYTTYSFTHTDFSLCNSVKIGNYQIVAYNYEDGTNHLIKLDYSNQDKVEYDYDNQGRLVTKTYEDGACVSYQYDNCGNLATVTDSETGIVTTYYYDLLNRNVGYLERSDTLEHLVTYIYDAENNLSSMTEVIDGLSKTYSYTYNEDNQLSSMTVDGVTVEYTYDSFGRLSETVTKQGDTVILTEQTGYNDTPTAASTQVIEYNGYTYSYDDNGNILSVSDGSNTITYVYDSQNQLIREMNPAQQVAYVWEYDNAGNIMTRKEYSYVGNHVGCTDTINYQYRDAQWGDLLTSYDGQEITYDQIGNPLNDGKWTYFWQHGRQLASMSNGAATWNYTYNADGLRTKRTNGANTYTYIYNNSQLTMMVVGENTLHFTYDASGVPLTVKYNGTTYYYKTNLQGDVIAIVDSTKAEVVSYAYNAWGVLLDISGTMAEPLGTINPLTYRGYVYDHETGLYYLQSRYYDPEMGRFISADNQISDVGGEILGYNMFAYCMNNPVNNSDPTGNWPKWATKLAIAAAVVVVVAVVAVVTVYTAGAGTAIAAAAVGAAKGAAIGFAVGAATGAAGGAISHRVTTGSWDGAGEAILNGMADGALSGSISGAISGGISGGVKAVAQSSSRVLWSGGDVAKNTAASYAKSIGGTTLEQTPKGKLLTGLTNTFGYDKTASLWQQASAEFASGARGNVTAIVSQSNFRGAGSILSQIEYPMVATRIIEGLADSFNVILIG